jgi:hypothetical protein
MNRCPTWKALVHEVLLVISLNHAQISTENHTDAIHQRVSWTIRLVPHGFLPCVFLVSQLYQDIQIWTSIDLVVNIAFTADSAQHHRNDSEVVLRKVVAV